MIVLMDSAIVIIKYRSRSKEDLLSFVIWSLFEPYHKNYELTTNNRVLDQKNSSWNDKDT